MADMEKVIEGLEKAKNVIERWIPMFEQYNAPFTIDCAIALLKKQEVKTGNWIEYPECLAYDGAYDDSWIVCSSCKHPFNIIDNCAEEFDYCPHCGAKMKGGEVNGQGEGY